MPRSSSGSDRNSATNAGTDRRTLLKYMAATGVVAGFAGCGGDGGDGASPTEDATPSPTSGSGSPGTDSATPTDQTETPTDQTETPMDLPQGGTFIAATTGTTNGLNVFRIGDGETSDRAALVMDQGYVRESPEYTDFLPLWFDDMTVEQPVNQVEITLREGLEYGDDYGELTVDDYLWNIENIWTADWANFTYENEFSVGAAQEPIEFEKVDDYTIRETIPSSRPFFPYNEPLSYMFPIPQEIAQPYVDEQDAEGLAQDNDIMRATFNGNLGPWDLKRWEQQSIMEFERAEDYYLRDVAEEDDRVPDIFAEAPYFDEYHIQYFGDSQTARQAIQADEIDTVYIPSNQVGSFQNQDDLKLYQNPYRSWSGYLGLNQRANGWTPFRNKQVRHAFAHIYHNEFIVENILDGRAGVQNTLYPTWGPYAPDDAVTFEGNLDTARQLLQEGTSSDYGYDGDTFVGPDGNQVELTLVYQSGELDDLRAEYLRQRLNEVGIALTQETTSFTRILQNYFTVTNPAEGFDGEIGYGDENRQPSRYNAGPRDEAVGSNSWDLMLTLGFGYGPLTPAGTIASLFAEEGNFNAYGYEPGRDLEAMRDEAQTAESREAARGTIQEMLQYISEERPVIFEYNPYNYYAYRDVVQNVGSSPPDSYWTMLQDRSSSRMYFSDGTSGR